MPRSASALYIFVLGARSGVPSPALQSCALANSTRGAPCRCVLRAACCVLRAACCCHSPSQGSRQPHGAAAPHRTAEAPRGSSSPTGTALAPRPAAAAAHGCCTVCSAQREQVARRGRSWIVEKTGAEDSREMRPLIAGAQARPGAGFSSQSP